MTKRIRALVADDSPFVCDLITRYLHSAPDFEVIGSGLNGRRAVEIVKELRPDVVTLDLGMPEMDGLQALTRIMREFPTPVVVVTGVSGKAATQTLQALDLGAVDFILKYTPGSNIDPEELRREIVAKVRTASQIRVVRLLQNTYPGRQTLADPHNGSQHLASESIEGPPLLLPGGLVIIGASTGGPVALRDLMGALPARFPPASSSFSTCPEPSPACWPLN